MPSVAEKPRDSLCRGNAAAGAVPRRSQKREIPLHNRGPTSRDLNAGFLRELRTCFIWIQWGFSGGREARPPAASSRPPRERALCALRALPATTSWPVTRPLGLPGKFELCQPALAEECFRPQHIRGGYHHAQGLPHPPFLSQEESLDVRSQDRVTVTVTERPGRTRMQAFLHSLPNRLVR